MNLVSGQPACKMIGALADGEAVWFWHPLLVLNSRRLERDGFELNRRGRFAHLAPLAGRGRIASAMPTGRANARPMTGSASSGAIRVRGTIREHESVETPPHPDPLPASGARGKWSAVST